MSAVPKAHHVNGGQIRMRYLEWGQQGRPLVLLHGLTTSADTWSLVAPILAASSHIYALDLRGHGESDKPDRGYDFPTLVEDVAGFFHAAGLGRVALAGQSWGASVALWFAAAHPGLVSHLILVDGGTFEPSRRPGATRDRWEQMLAPEEIYVSREVYLHYATQSLGHRTPEIEAVLMASVHLNADGSVSEKLSRENQVRILQEMWDYHPGQLYPHIACPVLLTAARSNDPERAAFQAAREGAMATALQALPQAQVLWLEDSAHDIQLQRPEQLAQAIESFLRNPSPA